MCIKARMYTSTSSMLKMLLTVTVASIFLLLNLPQLITADHLEGSLDTDKAALLAFYYGLPSVGTRLAWDPNKHVCEWIGITCTEELPKDPGKVGGGGASGQDNRVVEVRLPAIGLYGAIAANSKGKLHALKVLSLRENNLYGNLPPDIFSISTLTNIHIQKNKFCGDLPDFPVPQNLEVVDFSFNSFSGKIPPVFSMTPELQSLNLESNKFSGPVPDFKDLKYLGELFLANNMLEGQIPTHLQKIEKASYDGNPGLCGPPLTTVCAADHPAEPPEPNAAANCNILICHLILVASSLLPFLLLLWN